MQINLNQTPAKSWLALTGVSIASFLGCIDFTIVNTALASIQTSLKCDIEQLQWVINIFILALSSCMVILGRVADVYGRRITLYSGMIVFALSSLLAGYSNTIQTLIFWRLIQGISCAILYTASGAIISSIFPPEKLGRAMGVFFGISFTGLAAGPVLGGIIVGALSWRWVFLVNVPVVIISLIICFLSVPESKNTTHGTKIDYPGALLLMLSISAFVFAIIKSNSWGITSLKTWTLLLTSIILSTILYWVEKKSASPIIKFSLFMNKNFFAGILANFFLAFFYCLAFFLMPLFLHNIRGESDYIVGLMLLPTTLMVALMSPIVGRIVDRKGPQKPLLWGFILFTISALLQVSFSSTTSIIVIIIAFIIMGVAWGAVVGPSTIIAMSALPASSQAVAIGMSWTLHNIGGTLGLSLGVLIYHLQLEKYANSFIAGYHGAMSLLIFSSLLCYLILSYCFKQKI